MVPIRKIEVDGEPKEGYAFVMILGYSCMKHVEFTLRLGEIVETERYEFEFISSLVEILLPLMIKLTKN